MNPLSDPISHLYSAWDSLSFAEVIFNQWVNRICMICPFIHLGKKLNRKRRFLFGLLFVTLLYALSIAGFAFARVFSYLLFTLAAFAVSIRGLSDGDQEHQTEVSDSPA